MAEAERTEPVGGMDDVRRLLDGEKPGSWDDVVNVLDLLGSPWRLLLLLHTPPRGADTMRRSEVEDGIVNRYENVRRVSGRAVGRKFVDLEEAGLLERVGDGSGPIELQRSKRGGEYHRACTAYLEAAADYDNQQAFRAFWDVVSPALYIPVVEKLGCDEGAETGEIAEMFGDGYKAPAEAARDKLDRLEDYEFVVVDDYRSGRGHLFRLTAAGETLREQIRQLYRFFEGETPLHLPTYRRFSSPEFITECVQPVLPDDMGGRRDSGTGPQYLPDL